jgi:hypothetical protein
MITLGEVATSSPLTLSGMSFFETIANQRFFDFKSGVVAGWIVVRKWACHQNGVLSENWFLKKLKYRGSEPF